jgi:hypothetical protein
MQKECGVAGSTHSQEDEDIPLWLGGVDLEHGRDSRVYVVGLGLGSVVQVHRISTSRDCKVQTVDVREHVC